MTTSQTTKGITVSVQSHYLPHKSRPLNGVFIHGYAVKIENFSQETVQLMTRHWFIQNGLAQTREVKGGGVVGQYPILKPGASHEYSSYCPMDTDMGVMWGYYTMIDTETQESFDVQVPKFKLIVPSKMN